MSKLRRIADIINILMMSLCISIPIMALIDTMSGNDAGGYPILLTGIFCIMAAAHLLRIFASKIIWYLLGHILLVAASLWFIYETHFSLDIYMAGAWFLLSFVILMVDTVFWTNAVNEEKNLPVQENGEPIKGFKPVFKEGLPYISVYFTTVFVIITFLAVYRGYERLRLSTYVSGIIYVALFLIRLYLENVSTLMETTELGNNVTQRRLLMANSKLVVPFIVLIIVAMTLFKPEITAGMIDKLLAIIIRGIAYIIAVILLLFSGGGADETDEPLLPQKMDMIYGENPAWVDVLFKILDYLLAAALIAIIVYLIVKVIIRLIKHYNVRNINTLKQHHFGDMTEVSERVESSTARKKRVRSRFVRMNNREKIRFLYKKFVTKAKKAGYEISRNHTPNERVRSYVLSESLDSNKYVTRVEGITPIYNRARYSFDEISDVDVDSCTKNKH